MNYHLLINETALWAIQYLNDQQLNNYCFHDLHHTMAVVNAAQKLADHYQLSEQDYFIVTAAAYFHDLGYFSGGSQDHEIRSADIAENFLKEKGVTENVIESVRRCIMATKTPQKPQNLLESIVCDADLFHLGGEHFVERNRLMRKEWKMFHETEVSREKWNKDTLKLMNAHQYHTDFARALLSEQKQKNIDLLKQSLSTESKKNNTEKDSNDEKKKKDNRPERGIETMFRVTSTNNQRLSDMADNKSNILITVNSIILSVVISLLLRKLDNNEHLTVPTLILLLVSLSTMVVAILATRPKVSEGIFTENDVDQKKVNLLFFGNFYKMGLVDYDAGMKKVMEDREFLYGMLTKDIYSQGVVLGRKYKLLRLAYNIFMFGLIFAVLSYLIVILA